MNNAGATEGPLLQWLLMNLQPMNRTRIKQLLQHGRISVNGVTVTRHDHELKVRFPICTPTAPFHHGVGSCAGEW